VELQDEIDCPSTFDKFLVDKSVPTTVDQPTSLDGPGPSTKHVVGEEVEKTDETQLLPTQPSQKDALTALLVLNSIVSSNDANDRIVKAVYDLQHFVCEVYNKV
jgi:hypothetical protein